MVKGGKLVKITYVPQLSSNLGDKKKIVIIVELILNNIRTST